MGRSRYLGRRPGVAVSTHVISRSKDLVLMPQLYMVHVHFNGVPMCWELLSFMKVWASVLKLPRDRARIKLQADGLQRTIFVMLDLDLQSTDIATQEKWQELSDRSVTTTKKKQANERRRKASRWPLTWSKMDWDLLAERWWKQR